LRIVDIVTYQTHEDVVDALLARWPEHRVGPSLDRIKAVVDMLGHPEATSPVISITGTNGKGSTAIIIDSLLRACGLRTGRFSSPHLEDITERIAIDGVPIAAELFDETWAEIEPVVKMVDERAIDGLACTFFEAMTGLAYAAFADAPVDVAVMEVGMGGRWDATSVADAAVAVVGPVGLDHMAYLGDTIAKIATEKAGIIKPESIAVLAAQTPEAGAVLAARCREVGAAMVCEGADFALLDRQLAAGGQVIRLLSMGGPVGELFLPLHGAHMARNAVLAVAACEQLQGRALSPDVIQQGFDAVLAPARLELVDAHPPIVLDTAHNPQAVTATLEAATEAFAFDPLIVVLGMMADKAVAEVLELLAPVAATVVVTQVAGLDRALPAGELAEMARDILGDTRVIEAGDSSQALSVARHVADQAGDRAGILVLGSVYLAGEVRGLVRRSVDDFDEEEDTEFGDGMYD